MRRARPPHVAVCVDSSGRYGRGVLQGIADYVDATGGWSLYIDPRSHGTYGSGWLRDWTGDGILAFIESRALARKFQSSRIPTVELYGHRLGIDLPQVGNDDRAIGRLAAEHLLERQFRRFAYSGYRGHAWVERRYRGFAEALKIHGYPCERFVGDRDPGTPARWERMQARQTEWLRDLAKPLGLMACSDRHAQRLLDACRRAGIAVPEEVAVIGVDNDEETCRLSDPPLSSIIDNPSRVGYEAARLLDGLMNGRRSASPVRPILVPPQGVAVRISTDVTAVEDPVVAQAMKTIRRDACQGLTLEQLLGEVHVSRSVFYRRFQSALGRTPHEEILRVRLDRVKTLLRQTSLSLERIANRAGFDHPEYLNVAFKRETGLTPGTYRERETGKRSRARRDS